MTIKEVETRTGLAREEEVLSMDREPVRIIPWRRRRPCCWLLTLMLPISIW